jgi:hypothetical protein
MTPEQLRNLSNTFFAESTRDRPKEETERAIMIALDLIELSFMIERRTAADGAPPS